MSKTVTCVSGLKGSQDKLQSRYANFEEFLDYCAVYDLHSRLGFFSPEEAWDANPTIQSSVLPEDLRVVPDPEALRLAVLEAIPYAVDSRLGTTDSQVTIHHIKDYFNPKRGDIITQATDAEIRSALRKLVLAGLIISRGLMGTRKWGRTASYTRAVV